MGLKIDGVHTDLVLDQERRRRDNRIGDPAAKRDRRRGKRRTKTIK